MFTHNGGIGIDATVPFRSKGRYTRARFPVEKFDYTKWFSEDKIQAMKAQQREYFHWMGESGYF